MIDAWKNGPGGLEREEACLHFSPASKSLHLHEKVSIFKAPLTAAFAAAHYLTLYNPLCYSKHGFLFAGTCESILKTRTILTRPSLQV